LQYQTLARETGGFLLPISQAGDMGGMLDNLGEGIVALATEVGAP
jgi:hypothetical protein